MAVDDRQSRGAIDVKILASLLPAPIGEFVADADSRVPAFKLI